MKLTVRPVRFALREPLRTAWGVLRERELLEVELDTRGGVGRGEAAPLEPYDGVSWAAVRAALDTYAGVLETLDDAASPGGCAACSPGDDVLSACRAAVDLPHALAAVDLALWDLEPGPAGRVPVNALVDVGDAAAAVDEGFTCVKLKVGVGEDVARVRAVREAVGPDVLIRVDANGAWGSPDEALRRLEALAPFGLELCEEPVHGIEALRAVRAAAPVPIAMDETAAADPLAAAASGAADYVCLKIARCGGISGVLAAARAAHRAGSGVYLASTFDGPRGIAAGLRAAAMLIAEGIPVAPCGLATLRAFAGVSGPPVVGGHITFPAWTRQS